MAKNKTKEKRESNTKTENTKDTSRANREEKAKAPHVDLPQREKEAKSKRQENREKRAQQYKNAKDEVKRRNGQVYDLRNELNEIRKQINRREEDIQNAYTQAEALKRESRDSKKSPEEKRALIDQADAFYAKAKEWESANRAAKEEAEVVKSRLDTAKYANIQSRRSFLEAMKSKPNGVLEFLRTLWEKTIFYKVYQSIASAILEGQTKQSQKSMLDQYDEIRKDQKVALEITRATKDVSHDLEKCLNTEEISEISKIEELAMLCGKSKATIIAQLDDKEVLQFKFNPAIDSLSKGTIEITKRAILQTQDGKAALGKEELVNSINYDGHKAAKLLNFSMEKQQDIKLSIYGVINPDGHDKFLQVADPDITKAFREELDRNVAEAHAWDPKKERADAEVAAKAAEAKREEEAAKKKQAEMAAAEKEKEQPDKEKAQEKTIEPKRYEKVSDFIYGRIDLNAMDKDEKESLREAMTGRVKAAGKDFKPSKEQEILSAKAVFNKLRAQEVIYTNNKMFDEKNGKEIMVRMSKEAEPISLTISTIKSDEFISKVYENIQAQAEKNKSQINDLLAGKEFPAVKDYEATVARTLRAEIMRAGDSRDAVVSASPVIVNSNRELVEKILKGEVVFAKDLNEKPAQEQAEEKNVEAREAASKEDSKEQAAPTKSANSEKQNHILVDKETGAQLVHLNEQGTMQTWTEHDFSEKDFARSVQREAEELNKAQEAAKEAAENTKEEAVEKAEETKPEQVEKESVETEKEMPQQEAERETPRETVPLVADDVKKEAEAPAIDAPVQEEEREESFNCPTLAEVSKEEISDIEVQDIKNRCYIIDADGYLHDDIGEKICNKDGEAYSIGDFEGTPKAYEYFQEKYVHTYGHTYSTDETILDPSQEEIYEQAKEDYIPQVEQDRYEEQQLDYDYEPGCDTVMNAASIHAHSPHYEDLNEIDNNYNGIPDIDEH